MGTKLDTGRNKEAWEFWEPSFTCLFVGWDLDAQRMSQDGFGLEWLY